MRVKDAIEELKNTKLWIYLDKIDPDYSNRAIEFLKGISDILSSINIYFPYYTRHDAHHGYQVIRRMAEILDPKCLKKKNSLSFSAEEVFLLICSAYGHDLGMAVFPGEGEQILNDLKIKKDSVWQTHPKLQEFVFQRNYQFQKFPTALEPIFI